MTYWKIILIANCLILLFAGLNGCSWKSEEEVRFSAIRHFQQGNVAFEQRDYHEALVSYHKAIELDSQSAEFHYNLGLTYYYVEKYELALVAFENAAKLAPHMAETYYNVALIYNKLYDTDKAHKFYNRYQNLMTKRKNSQLQEQRASPPKKSPPAPQQVGAQPQSPQAKKTKGSAAQVPQKQGKPTPPAQAKK